MDTNTQASTPTSLTQEAPQDGNRLLTGSMAFVALRCTLQYVLLPFVLPIIGWSGLLSALISVVIDVLALGMIVFNVRRLWSTHWRWRYLGLAVVMTVIIAIFLYQDFRFLTGTG